MADRVQVGVVGCGLIAQVMHLPHLLELDELFELGAVCDLSEPTAAACAARFGHPPIYTNWEQMLQTEPLDAVLVLTSGSHAPVAIAAARSGRHVLVEKPMCITPDEGREMVDAARVAGVQLMVGTMKRYDPAYERLLELLPDAGELRLVRVTTLESPWEPYVEGYPLARPGLAAPEIVARLQAEDDERVAAALPDGDEQTRFCYRWMLLDNLVHELNALRGALGEPDLIKYVELTPKLVNISLSFGEVECHLSWVDLPGIGRYRQEFSFYALDQRLTLTFPSPYLRGFPSELAIEGGRPDTAHAWRTVETVSYIEAFKRELLEFHAAITDQLPGRTDGIDGLHDVTLCHSLARAHLTKEQISQPSELFGSEVRA